MAFVEFDQSQRKPVAVLVAILLLAVGVTVYRINHVPVEKPVRRQSNEPKRTHQKVTCVQGGICELTRNPFVRPARFKAMGSTSSRGLEFVGDSSEKISFSKSNTPEELAPIPVPNVFATDNPNPPAQKHEGHSAPKPSYVLLATVRDRNGASAVISDEHDGVRVVEVGDRVAGGLKVKKIETGRVVLADGRDIVIAKRPRS